MLRCAPLRVRRESYKRLGVSLRGADIEKAAPSNITRKYHTCQTPRALMMKSKIRRKGTLKASLVNTVAGWCLKLHGRTEAQTVGIGIKKKNKPRPSKLSKLPLHAGFAARQPISGEHHIIFLDPRDTFGMARGVKSRSHPTAQIPATRPASHRTGKLNTSGCFFAGTSSILQLILLLLHGILI